MDPSEHTSEPREIERLLGTFAARAPRVDRDRLMFLAGRAAAEAEANQRGELEQGAERNAELVPPTHPTSVVLESPQARTPWYWPVSTLISTSLALLLAVALVARGERTGSETHSIAGANSPSTANDSKASTPAARNANADRDAPAPDENRADETAPRKNVERSAEELAPPLVARREAPSDSSLTFHETKAIQWREVALRDGVDALPVSFDAGASSDTPLRYGSALQSLSQRPWSWVGDTN